MCENCFGLSFLLNTLAITHLIPFFTSKSPGALVVSQPQILCCTSELGAFGTCLVVAIVSSSCF